MRDHGLHNSNARYGSILVVVLVSLLVASLLGLGLIKTVLIHHRQTRVFSGGQQAFWLAEAGVQRAARKLAETSDYVGETWEVPADVLGLSRTADVTIEVVKADGKEDEREIHVAVLLDDGRAPPAGYHRKCQYPLPSQN